MSKLQYIRCQICTTMMSKLQYPWCQSSTPMMSKLQYLGCQNFNTDDVEITIPMMSKLQYLWCQTIFSGADEIFERHWTHGTCHQNGG